MRICREPRTSRHGYVLVLFVVFLPFLFGMIGLIIDMGLMMTAQRKAQNAADSGALAAVVELSRGNSSNIVSEATWYVANQNGAAIPALYPPQAGPRIGPYAGNTSYVEVYASVTVTTQFLHFLGFSSSQTVQARAVAGYQLSPFTEGILLLDPHTSGALISAGNGGISVANGGTIWVNSDSGSAAQTSGNHATVTASSVNVVGGTSGSGFVGTVNTGVSPIYDPLAYLPAPDPTGMTVRTVTGTSLQPGRYVGGISLSGGTTTFAAGIYYMDGGGFKTSGQAGITGSGIMIYNAPITATDVISLTGQGTLNLSPPTSGTYQGLTIYQARTSTNTVTVAGNGGSIQGTIYAASAQVNIAGNGGFTGAQILSGTLSTSGNGVDVIGFGGNTALAPVIFLVE